MVRGCEPCSAPPWAAAMACSRAQARNPAGYRCGLQRRSAGRCEAGSPAPAAGCIDGVLEGSKLGTLLGTVVAPATERWTVRGWEVLSVVAGCSDGVLEGSSLEPRRVPPWARATERWMV